MDLYKCDDLKVIDTTEEMMKKILHEPEEQMDIPMIIAMKGDAYSGKTTCADAIAKYYKCPVISFDSMLDSLSGSSAPPSQHEADRIADRAFEAVIRLVKLQLRFGRPTVVDSCFSNPSHQKKLLQLGEEFKSCKDKACTKVHCGFVIVECRPETKYAWQQKFEKRDPQDKWYKPKEWEAVKHSPSIEHCDPGLLFDHVCRLIVDTTGYVNYRNLGPATHDLTWCPKGHLLNFRDWLPNNPIHKDVTFLKTTKHGSKQASRFYEDLLRCGKDGRHLLEGLNDRDVSIGCCRACQGPISYPDPAYACTRCKLALHKPCAELQEKAMIPDPHSNLPPFLRNLSSADEFYFSIPEEHKERFKCGSCREFSVDCEFCLWEMHLGAREVPTIVHHEGHHGGSHPLCFWITSRSAVDPREYQCEACKSPGSCVGYTCLVGMFRYNVHVECALLPRPLRHGHGGHKHEMKLVFGTEELKEDYICDQCLDPMDPKAWYYSCEQCVFVSHLHCVYAID